MDVISRSQRARVCEYKRNDSVLLTPSMIGSKDDSNVWIETVGNRRVLHFMEYDIEMESGLRTTSNSGMQSDILVKDGVAMVRLPDRKSVV